MENNIYFCNPLYNMQQVADKNSDSQVNNETGEIKTSPALLQDGRVVKESTSDSVYLSGSQSNVGEKEAGHPFASFLRVCQGKRDYNNESVPEITQHPTPAQSSCEKMQVIHECFGIANDSKRGRIIHKKRLVGILKKYSELKQLANTLDEGLEYYIQLEEFYKKNEHIIHAHQNNIENDINHLQSDFIKTALSVICEVVEELASEGVQITGGLAKSLLISEKSNRKRALPFNDIDIVVPNGFSVIDFLNKIDAKKSPIVPHQGAIHYNKSDTHETIQTISIKTKNPESKKDCTSLWLDFCTLKKESLQSISSVPKDEIKKAEKIKKDYQGLQRYLGAAGKSLISTQNQRKELGEQERRNLETLSKANFFLQTLQEIESESKKVAWRKRDIPEASKAVDITTSLSQAPTACQRGVNHETAGVFKKGRCENKPVAVESAPVEVKPKREKAKSQIVKAKPKAGQAKTEWVEVKPKREKTKSQIEQAKPKARPAKSEWVEVKSKRNNADSKVEEAQSTREQTTVNRFSKSTISNQVQDDTPSEHNNVIDKPQVEEEIKQPIGLSKKKGLMIGQSEKVEELTNNAQQLPQRKPELSQDVENPVVPSNEHSDNVEENSSDIKVRSVKKKAKRKNKGKNVAKSGAAEFLARVAQEEKNIFNSAVHAKAVKAEEALIIYEKFKVKFEELKERDKNFEPRKSFEYSEDYISKNESEVIEYLDSFAYVESTDYPEGERSSYSYSAEILLCRVYESLLFFCRFHLGVDAEDINKNQYETPEKMLRCIINQLAKLTFKSVFYYLKNYRHGKQLKECSTEKDTLSSLNELLDDFSAFRKKVSLKITGKRSNFNLVNLSLDDCLTTSAVVFKYLLHFDYRDYSINDVFASKIQRGVLPIIISAHFASIKKYNSAFNYFTRWFDSICQYEQDALEKEFYSGHKYFLFVIKEPELLDKISRNLMKYNRFCFKNSLTYEFMFRLSLHDKINKKHLKYFDGPTSIEDLDGLKDNYNKIKGLGLLLKSVPGHEHLKDFVPSEDGTKKLYSLLKNIISEDLELFTRQHEAAAKDDDPDKAVEMALDSIKISISHACQHLKLLYKINFQLDLDSLECFDLGIPSTILSCAEMHLLQGCMKAVWVNFFLCNHGKTKNFTELLVLINELLNSYSYLKKNINLSLEYQVQSLQETGTNIKDLLICAAISFKYLFNFENSHFELAKKHFSNIEGVVFKILLANYLLASNKKFLALALFKKWFSAVSDKHQCGFSTLQVKSSEFFGNFLVDDEVKNYIKDKVKPKGIENIYNHVIRNIDYFSNLFTTKPASDFSAELHRLDLPRFFPALAELSPEGGAQPNSTHDETSET